MGKTIFPKSILIKSALWGAIFLTAIALIYHIRWFTSFIIDKTSFVVPAGQEPMIWFLVQICNNLVFLYAGYLLLQLFNKYQQTGFFDGKCIVVLDRTIYSCIALAVLGIVKLGFSSYNDTHINEVNAESLLNYSVRFLTNILFFKEPQTMYLLLVIILWTVKQFVSKAISVKSENEKFI
ncbi:MAG: hypothetical protein U0U70_10120 [Chitinophagaceae bacterium]